jgi:hypothetical protein
MLEVARGASAIDEFAIGGIEQQLIRNKADETAFAAEISAKAVQWMAAALSSQLTRAKALVLEAQQAHVKEKRP